MTITQIVTCDGCGCRQQEGEQYMLVTVERWGKGSTLCLHFHTWQCMADYAVRQSEGVILAYQT